MPRNGSGTYVLPTGQPVVNGTTISATVFNTLTADISNALTTSLPTDGQSPMTGPLVGATASFSGTVTAPTFVGALTGNAATATTATTATTVSGTVAVANGGTGATTAATALTNLGAAALSGAAFTGAVSTTGSLSATGTITGASVRAIGTDIPSYVNSTNSRFEKVILQDNGTTRGFLAANASYCFAAVNAADNTSGLTVDNSGNCVAFGTMTSAGVVSATANSPMTSNSTNSYGIKLTMQDAGTNRGFIGASASYAFIAFNSGGGNALLVDNSGNTTATGNITANSDERLKTNWRALPADFLPRLASVKYGIYDRTDINATQAGVSAQSLQSVIPEAVQTDGGGILSVAYGNAALVSVIELAKEIVSLKAKIERMQNA